MMADLKSIELSSFTFDMVLNYCFLVVYLLMMSQSQSRTPYDVTTILYYIRYSTYHSIYTEQDLVCMWFTDVHVATMYVYNEVHGIYMYYGTCMGGPGHACISVIVTTGVPELADRLARTVLR